MNWYKIIFYHLFKRYYKDGKYKNDIPWLTAAGILSVSTFFLLTGFFTLIYYLFVKKNVPQLDYKFTLLGFLFTALNCFWFANKKHYLRIYEEYKTSKVNNTITEILSWLFVILGFASLAIVALLIKM